MDIAEPHRTKKIKEHSPWPHPQAQCSRKRLGHPPPHLSWTAHTIHCCLRLWHLTLHPVADWDALGELKEQVDSVSTFSLWLDPNIKSSHQHLPGKGLSTHLMPQPLWLTPKGWTLQSPHPSNQGYSAYLSPTGLCNTKNQFSLVTHRPKEKGWKRQSREMEKNVGVTVVISDKIDCKPKHVTRDKGGHYIMTNMSIHQGNRTTVYVCKPKLGALQYIKHLLKIKGKIGNHTIIIWTSIPYSAIEQSYRKSVKNHWI